MPKKEIWVMQDLWRIGSPIGKDFLLVILLSAVIFGYAHLRPSLTCPPKTDPPVKLE